MNNDAFSHDLNEVMALAQVHMRELAAAQQQRMTLSGSGTAADGLVKVTVDAQRMVTNTVIDESYLREYELADLGGHVTTAAQAAGREVEQRSAALFAPLQQGRQAISALSGTLTDAPDLHALISGLSSANQPMSDNAPPTDEDDDGLDENSRFPQVRR